MTARDDYGDLESKGGDELLDLAYRMCDEIDLLRDKHRTLWNLGLAKDELIRELTKHADTMRELLENAAINARAQDTYYDDEMAAKYDKAIRAYDEFIKEA